MVISLFKKNDITALLLLVPYAIIVRLYSLMHPVAYAVSDDGGVLSRLFFGMLGDSPLTQSILGIVLVILQGALINFQINNNRLLTMQSGFAGALYVLFASFFLGQQGLSPALIAMTFVLLACFSAYGVYKTKDATAPIVNTSIYLAIATLFYPPYSLLIIALFIQIAVLRSFGYKERLQYIFTLLSVFWIVGALLFYLGWFDPSAVFAAWGLAGSLPMLWSGEMDKLIPLVITTVGVAFALTNYYNFMKKKGIEARRKINFFFWVLLIAFLSVFLFRNLDASFFYLVAFPLSILASMSFTKQKNNYRNELIHIIILILAFWCQYQFDIPGLSGMS